MTHPGSHRTILVAISQQRGAAASFKEVSRVEVIEIIRRWQANASLRGLARNTGLARKTFRKYLQAAEKCGLTRDGPPPARISWSPGLSASGIGSWWSIFS